MNKQMMSFALIGLLAVSSLTGCVQEPQITPPANLPQVSVASVIHQELTEWDEFTGRLEAPESVQLRPRVTGYISDVVYQEGAIVAAGDVLFEIDDRPFLTEVARLQAELSNASSQLMLARKEHKRAKELVKRKAIAQELLDNRLASYQQAVANVDAVKAALSLARLNLSYTKVIAPIDGRVSKAMVTKGNFVSAGQQVLTSIVSTKRVYAYFDADEQAYLNYAKQVRSGSRPNASESRTPVFLALAGESSYEHEGFIDFVDNRVDPQSGTIKGRAVFKNSGEFIPGLFARIQIVSGNSYKGILIDDRAINTDLNKKFVLVVGEDNVANYRQVELGAKLAGLRIIKSGLNPDEKIIVSGLQRVRSGMTIDPVETKMTSQTVLDRLDYMQARVDKLTKQQVAELKVPNVPSTEKLGG